MIIIKSVQNIYQNMYQAPTSFSIYYPKDLTVSAMGEGAIIALGL